jgi:hypothetical protein
MLAAQSESSATALIILLFMANTGLRPDEAMRLEYRDVQIVKDGATNETILEIEVRGKRGIGHCKSMTGAVPYCFWSAAMSPAPSHTGTSTAIVVESLASMNR